MRAEGWVHRHRYALATALAVAAYLAAWWLTRGAWFTYDEATYIELARHPLTSSYYPDAPFLRHPPLSFYLLSAWQELGLPLRLWAPAWVVPALVLTGDMVRRREGPAWLALAPALLLPVFVALLTVTPYPPMFALLALALWAHAAQRPVVEAVGWNLAVLVHELALLYLALVLGWRALDRVRERRWDPRGWLRLVAPYPAAVAWGLVMVGQMGSGADPRGGSLVDSLLSVVGADVLGLRPLHALVLGLALVPLLPLADRDQDRDGLGRASYWGVVLLVAISPFYRYAVAALPALLHEAAGRPRMRLVGRDRPAVGLALLVLASSVAGVGVAQGWDVVNAADVPGLWDHGAAAPLAEEHDRIALRSPPSMALALQEEGWRVVATGPGGPTILVLERGDRRVELVRFDSKGEARDLAGDVDAYALPARWDDVERDVTARGYRPVDRVPGLVLLARGPVGGT